MDFITKLLASKDLAIGVIYDLILVMVDTLTKYAHFVPCEELMTAMNSHTSYWTG